MLKNTKRVGALILATLTALTSVAPLNVNAEENPSTNTVVATDSTSAFAEGIKNETDSYRLMVEGNDPVSLNSGSGVSIDNTSVLSFSNVTDYKSAVDSLSEKFIVSEDDMVEINAMNDKFDSSALTNGTGKKVALIDTGVNGIDTIDLTGEGTEDTNGHGTAMARIILDEAEHNADILSIKAIGKDGKGKLSNVYAGFKIAMEEKADIINLSLSMKDNENTAAFKSLINEATQKGIMVVVSAGNNGSDAKNYFPADMKDAVTVGYCFSDGMRSNNSNYGDIVDYYAVQSSSSRASAVIAGKLAKGEQNIVDSSTVYTNDGLHGDPVELPVAPDNNLSDELFVADSSVNLTEGAHQSYAGAGFSTNGSAFTTQMGLTDANGRNGEAFCVQPWRDAPSTAAYSAQETNNDAIRKLLYYGAGGPGDIGNSYVSTHLMVAYYWLEVLKSDGSDDAHRYKWAYVYDGSATGGQWLNSADKEWVRNEATSIINNYPSPDANFTVYFIPSSNKQDLMGWTYVPPIGHASVRKVSSDSNYTNNDSHFSLAGATYVIKNSGGAEVGRVTTDGNGNSNTIDLAPGTYSATEVTASKGFALDPSVHTFNLASGETYTVTSTEPVGTGTGSGRKLSANTSITSDNKCYSLAGAVYGVYNKWGQEVTRLTTDANGNTPTATLSVGMYTVKEISASKGFLLDTNTYPMDVSSVGNAASFTSTEPVGLDPAGIEVKKIDGNNNTIYPLSGAQYTIKYYDGFYTESNLPETAKRTWVIETKNVNGKYKAYLEDSYKVAGDSLYKNTEGTPVLPLGTISVEETKAPGHYTTDVTKVVDKNGSAISSKNKVVQQIRDTQQIVKLVFGNEATYNEITNYGGFKVQKYDYDSSLKKPQTSYDFTTEFAVINNNKPNENGEGLSGDVTVNGKTYSYGQTAFTFTTDSNGFYESAANLLPAGKYILKETKAPEGYFLTGDTTEEFTVKDNGKIVDLTDHKISDQVKRGDITFDKEDTNQTRLANIPFLISRVDRTGKVLEQHTVVSDSNGVLTTANRNGYKHSNDTNKGRTYKDGVWFGDGPVDDSMGALPDGEYVITELPCDHNTVLEMVSIHVTVNEGMASVTGGPAYSATNNNFLIHIGTITDADTSPAYSIKSEAYNKAFTTDPLDPVRTMYAVDNQTIVDEVEVLYDNVVLPGDYTVVSVLMDKNTMMPYVDRNGNTYKVVTPFQKTAAMRSSLGIEFSNVDLTGFDGDLVVFEYLYQGSYNEAGVNSTIAHDTNFNNAHQTLKVASVNTNAIDKITETRAGAERHNDKVEDKVSLKNLKNGYTYIYEPFMLNRENGQRVDCKIDSVKLGNRDITATEQNGKYYFELNSTKGTLTVDYSLDSTKFEGQTVVCAGNLYFASDEDNNDRLLIAHDDVMDENQSIHYPKIRTFISDNATKDRVGVLDNESKVTDKVVYENLVPGVSYVIDAELVKASNNKTLATSKVLFTPDKANGSIDAGFKFDSSALKGDNAVAVMDLKVNDEIVTTHRDMADKDETLNYVDLHTKASDASTSDNVGSYLSDNAKINDTVSFKNLVPGKEYTVKGVLMDKTSEKELVDLDGKAITAEKTFKATSENMEVPMEFTVSKNDLKGKTVVVFEDVFHNGIKIGSHSDINDEDQTVRFPEIHTTALDSATKTHQGTVCGTTTVIDTVDAKNLVVGKEYTLKGTLMDKSTGKAIIDKNGNEITSSKTFVAEKVDDKVNVTFEVDSNILVGKTIVAFETLSHKDIEVAFHTDIKDKEQTVYFPEIHTTAIDADTKEHMAKVSNGTTIIDTVSYKNLIPDTEYTLAGTLVNKKTGDALKDGNGNKITANMTFRTEKSDKETVNGKAVVKFNFDATINNGIDVVVFERLMDANGVVIAAHTDLTDENQTVKIPSVKTTATDKKTSTHVGTVEKEAVINDKVAYKGLLTGKEYTVKGVLMDKATNKPIMDKDNSKITAETKFKAGTSDGTVELTYKLDSSLLKGSTVVVFEDLYEDDVLLFSHSDITDEDQSIHYPEIQTSARFNDGNKDCVAADSMSVIDTVSFKNLIPGMSYKVVGVLMDKTTGNEALDASGNKITSEVVFTPENADGSIDVTFKFNGLNLENHELVVYEKLIMNDIEVASHSDINDEGQTVNINAIPPAPQTYDIGKRLPEGLFLAGASAMLAVLLKRRKDRKVRKTTLK